jgi:hypothetical protein
MEKAGCAAMTLGVCGERAQGLGIVGMQSQHLWKRINQDANIVEPHETSDNRYEE